MPGVLWKKFDSKTIASNLAFIGSIKDDILDVEELAMNLLDEVRRNYPDLVAQRYKLDAETLALPPYELLEAIGRKRGLLVRGGEVNTERCAIMLVDEFRACKWGRISLVERPPQRDGCFAPAIDIFLESRSFLFPTNTSFPSFKTLIPIPEISSYPSRRSICTVPLYAALIDAAIGWLE